MEKQPPKKDVKYVKPPIFKQQGKARPGDVTKQGMKFGPDLVVPWNPCMFPRQVPPGVMFKLRITGLNQADVKSITAEYMIGEESYQQTLHSQHDIGDRWESNTVYVAEFLLRHDMPDNNLSKGKGITGLRFKIEYQDGKWPNAPNAVLPEFEVYVEENAYAMFFAPPSQGKGK